jgi:Mg-chelatase subunit ChlD
MTALVNALDNYIPNQFGENGHVEYGWSNNIQEKILQFSFQLTRTNEDGVSRLSIILNDLLTNLKHNVDNGTLPEKQLAKGYLSILYRMIGHTRDIVDGKGEYTLSYMMIYTWNKFYPSLAQFALRCFVKSDEKDIHQYGSWKDLKYFCEYCKSQGDVMDSSLMINFSVYLINNQIRNDHIKTWENSDNISLAAKWVPREKSSFGWLYELLATDYFCDILATAKTSEQKRKAVLKCKTDYRKILSTLNRKIDTTQVKQCGNEWSQINFNKVTSITLSKQKKAFLNIKKTGEVRCPYSFDRKACAENFNAHIQRAVNGDFEMKGKRVGMADFTKQARDLIRIKNGSQSEKDLLNSQWRDNSRQNGALGKMIAMVDVSGSMEGDPMDVAIALGIRIAEKSVIGKRVMTFSSTPTWVNLESYTDFISQVDVVQRAPWGMNTNFHAALDMILDAIVQNKMASEDVQDMVLVILSDMQMDAGDICNKQTLYDTMKAKYEAAGIRINGVPYKPPHILFWNLRSTSGFPSLANQPNASMMSGFSPALLNLFCEQGLDALQSCTPWALLVKSLENERYKIMEQKFNEQI